MILTLNPALSCLYIRSRTALTTALSITPSYLINPSAISGLVTDYRDWQIPLGRRFRALKIWFVLRSYGVAALRTLVRKHIGLGDVFAGLVRGRSDILQLVAEPRYALTVVRCMPPRGGGEGTLTGMQVDGQVNGHAELNGHGDAETLAELYRAVADDAGNALTKKVYEAVNAGGEVFLTSTVVDGTYAIRIVSANERADERYVRRAFEVLVETYDRIVEEGAGR